MVRVSRVRVEFFGVARARAGRDAAEVECPEGATLGDLLASLVEAVPELNGAVISVDGRSLAEGSIASLDGECFTRDSSTVLPDGKPVLLLPAASGG